MKYLVFSDTHFDNTFDDNLYKNIESIINNHDKVIILGDLFEGYKINFKDFLKSDWSNLFPLLKSKHSIYIPGNHDPIDLIDIDKAKLFCDEIIPNYEISTKFGKYKIIHGNEFSLTPDKKYKVYKFPLFIRKLALLINNYENNQKIYAKFIKKNFKKIENYKIKKLKNINKTNYWLISGHEHFPLIIENKKYINTGFIKYGFMSYLTITENGHKLTITNY